MDELDLYNEKIMQLAGQAKKQGELPRTFMHQSQRTSPLCGSRVECGFDIKNGVITDIDFIAKSCALGSASAVITAQFALGKDLQTIEQARQALYNMLKNGGETPNGIFTEYAIFAPCVVHRARHAAILLPLDAILAGAV